MRDGTPDPATQPMGDFYSCGNFMYEHSKIARNQIEALNIAIHKLAGINSPKMEKELIALEKEAKQLRDNPKAIEEYIEANRLWKEKNNETIDRSN